MIERRVTMIDKKKLHTISASTLVALLIIFFIPFETAGRIIAAVLMTAIAVVSFVMAMIAIMM